VPGRQIDHPDAAIGIQVESDRFAEIFRDRGDPTGLDVDTRNGADT
jgi:hypothetical protein